MEVFCDKHQMPHILREHPTEGEHEVRYTSACTFCARERMLAIDAEALLGFTLFIEKVNPVYIQNSVGHPLSKPGGSEEERCNLMHSLMIRAILEELTLETIIAGLMPGRVEATLQ